MHIIPVIDLKDEVVVHARAGNRNQYHAVKSRLAYTSQPVDILNGILSVYDFDTVYIADLNAITGRGNQRDILIKIRKQFPHLCIWLDAGLDTAQICLEVDNFCPVFGSETGIRMNELQKAMDCFTEPVLSLDFHQGVFLGDENLLIQEACWPERIIIMDLDKVGTASGQDHDHTDLIHTNSNHRYYLAGGIRNIVDIQIAESIGAFGVLLATALHQKMLARHNFIKFV